MTKKYHNIFIQYIITALIAGFVAFIIALTLELELFFRCEDYVVKNELNMANLVKFATIEQLEKNIRLNPKNYVAAIKLAKIYEEVGQLDLANKLYQNALKFSERSNYTLYNYATFCVRQKLFVLSSALCEEIKGNSPKEYKYKADIYELTGDTLDELNEFEGALRAYQISYKYAKNIKDSVFLANIKKKYANEYINIADKFVEKNEIDNAIAALENSIKINDSPIANYKLSLIYIEKDKIKAEKYMRKALEKEPYIINPYIYSSLLNSLLTVAKMADDVAAINYYNTKLNKFKTKVNEIYLYKSDVAIDNTSIIKKKDDYYYLDFNLTNKTKYKIEQLFLYVEIIINSKTYQTNKKVIHAGKILYPGQSMEHVQFQLPKDLELINVKFNNNAIIKYYGKKRTKAPLTLLKFSSFYF